MRELFSNLLPKKLNGEPNEPYDFQLRVSELILKGRNVVLTAPTGSGKTWTSLFPFVYARLKKLEFADRVIYALPLRTLASSLYESTRQKLSDYGIKATIQMGNQPEDPLFEGDVIFTTIDQLLSTYIGLPFGTSKASSNIPAGALIGSFIIIDEFHLLSYTEALPTFLDMMKRLYPYTRFLLMTATAPKTVVTALEKHIRGQTVFVSKEEYALLPSKRRRIFWVDSPLSGEEVIERHHGGRTLVIVNEVKKAQDIYFQLEEVLKRKERQIEVRVLHSRMFPEHRQKVESWVLDRFTRNSAKEAILIATQVVEVGLDISANLLLTDLCPVNALIQRIGRCARFPGESGNVFVYSVREGGKANFLPYALGKTDKDNWQVMVSTEEILKQIVSGTEITPEIEEYLVATVHGSIDQERITNVMRDLFIRSDDITRALITGDADTRGLIRNIDNLSVLLHHTPEQIDLLSNPPMLSIGRRTLHSYIKSLKIAPTDIENRKLLYVPEFPDCEDISQDIVWLPLKSYKQIFMQTLVVLSPEIADYHPIVGLLLRPGSGTVISEPSVQKKENIFKRYSYQRETYIEHIKWVRIAHRKEKEKYKQATKYIGDILRLSPAKVEEISELTSALHDVGKLGVDFQRKLRRWQVEYKQRDEQELLAHTDFDGQSRQDREAYRRGDFKRPHHAAEGAIALQEWLGKTFNKKIAVPILLAILRHHYAFSERSEPITFAKGAKDLVVESLSGIPYEPFLKPQKESFHFDTLIRWLQDPNVLAFYWYLVRRLRLSDRKSQENRNLSKQKEVSNDRLQ